MISNNFCTIIFGRLGDRVRGPLLPPFSSDPLIKSFHFWPRPASHQYQKSERASEASFHPYFYSLLHCWARRTIYAAGACHNFCDWRIPLFFSFSLPFLDSLSRRRERRKVTMPKNVLVTAAAKRRRRRRRENLFGRYANAVPYANMLDDEGPCNHQGGGFEGI